MNKGTFFFIFLTFYCLNAFNQGNNIRFDHISTLNGLPHNLVFTIAEDKQGFIWMGTSNGLARYDGYEFKIYQPQPGELNSLSNKGVSRIYIDKKQNLWLVLLNNGINRFNPTTHKFDRFENFSPDSGSVHWSSVRSILCDSKENIWIGTDNGLLKFNESKMCFENIFANQPITLKNTEIWDFKEYGNNRLVIAAGNQLLIADLHTLKIQPFRFPLDKSKTERIQKIALDKSENLWVITQNNGAFCFEHEQKKWQQFYSSDIKSELPGKGIVDIITGESGDIYILGNYPQNWLSVLKAENRKFYKFNITQKKLASYIMLNATDKQNNFWIGTYEGLFKYSSEFNNITVYESDPFDQGSLANNYITSLFVDRNNILWVGVYKNGIDKVDLKRNIFNCYLRSSLKSGLGLPGNNITAILQDSKGDYWIGEHDLGVTRYDKYWNRKNFYPVDFNTSNSLNITTIGAICEDTKGNIWLGSWSGGINIINSTTGYIRHLSGEAKGHDKFAGWNIRKMEPDNQGNIWITTGNVGLVKYDVKADSFVYHSIICKSPYKQAGFYRTIFFDNANRLWAGSQAGGLELIDFKTCKLVSYKNEPNKPHTLSNNTVYSIYQQNDSIYWIGTAQGLNRFNLLKNEFTEFDTRNGLCNNTIYSLLPDNKGNLWISTDMGLSKFNMEQKSFTNFYVSDGLLSNEFSSNAYFKTDHDELFYGTSQGMISFYPFDTDIETHQAIPVLTGFNIFNKEVNVNDTIFGSVILKQDISQTKQIELNYKQNIFSIEFAGLHYSSNDKIMYLYKLENFDSDWTKTKPNHRTATYTRIPYGKYIFRLKCANYNGVWNYPSSDIALTIIIKPPFWGTLLFKICIILIIVLTVSGIMYYRIYRLNYQKEILAKMVKDRTQALEETNTVLEEKQEEINIQNEELQTQKEALVETNIRLQEKQEEILSQNRELDRHRNNLEKIVEERTYELEKAKKRAEESDMLKSAFLANMSHEIRTPMNAIVGFSTLLSTTTVNDDEFHKYVKYIKNNSNSLMMLIEEILDLSKIQTNQISLYFQPIIISDFLKEIYESYKVQARSKEIEINLHTLKLPSGETVNSDPYRLKQIITNLLNNALKFTESGFIELGINLDYEGFITFYVKDSGIGIPKHIGDSVFDRFFKVEHYETQSHGGVGLGLAICKSLVELLGGTIWYESEEGKGTIFFFTIPYKNAIDEINTPKLNIDEMIEMPDLHDKSILVAEDEEDNYILLLTLLNKTKARIIGVKNGLEAIEYVKDNDVDLIFMDLKMPVLNGEEATKKIKAMKPHIPIIAQTAYALKDEKEKYLKAGFVGYLTKPINFDELGRILKEVLK